MKRRICLTAALILFSLPAMAQENCVVPYAPTIPKGETATRDQIVEAQNQVMAFIKASDEYQRCLLVYMNQEDATAASEKRLPNAAIKLSLTAKGDANQREKVRVGTEYNNASRAWRAANPAPPAN